MCIRYLYRTRRLYVLPLERARARARASAFTPPSSRRYIPASTLGRGDDTVEPPHRAFPVFELILLLNLGKQFSIEQFEATASQSTLPSPLLHTNYTILNHTILYHITMHHILQYRRTYLRLLGLSREDHRAQQPRRRGRGRRERRQPRSVATTNNTVANKLIILHLATTNITDTKICSYY